ncbi:Peptidyl-Prolyl Cis-Trans Isomerase A [Manis pentadactyla]|nr:Peptidyl-Prolyl Cis-Trans Isomerase A [Manis pentadactyla]
MRSSWPVFGSRTWLGCDTDFGPELWDWSFVRFKTTANPTIFSDINGEPLGRMFFKLFADKFPKTTENFHARSTGGKIEWLDGKHVVFGKVKKGTNILPEPGPERSLLLSGRLY